MSAPTATGSFPASGAADATGVSLVACTTESLVVAASRVNGIRKRDLQLGDRVLVVTRNSVYSISVLGDGSFAVSGGWFDAADLSPATVGINGCTWGGSAILSDLLAAPGLFLEFANRVKTTRIREVRVIHAPETDPVN